MNAVELMLDETFEEGVFIDEKGNELRLAEGQLPEHTGALVARVSLEAKK